MEKTWRSLIRKYHVNLTADLMVIIFLVTVGLLGYYGVEGVEAIPLFNVGYSAIALLSSVILFLCCALDGTQKDRDRRTFMLLVFVNFIAMALNWISFFLDGRQEYRGLITILGASVLALDCVISYLAVEYLISITDLFTKKGVTVLRRLSAIGALAGFLGALSNLFIPLYFTVDEKGVSHESSFYGLAVLYPVLAALMLSGVALFYRKHMKLRRVLAAVAWSLSSVGLIVVSRYISRFYINYAVTFLFLLIIYLIVAVENGNKGAVTENELNTAKKIQEGMLPNLFPDYVNVPEFDIFAMLLPAREVGGDYYDFFMLDDNRFAFLLGDVSGNGVGAALFMAVSKSMINMRTQMGGSPAEILTSVNQRIAESNDQAMFAGVWLGILDISTGHMIYSNAGQSMPAFAIRNDGPGFRFMESAIDPPVGVMDDIVYQDEEIDLQPGDRIFLYTDGIPEAKAKDGTRFDHDRLLQILNENRDTRNEELCFAVMSAVTDYQGDMPQTDDITMLGLTYKGNAKERQDG